MATRSLSLVAPLALAIGLPGCINNNGTFHSPDGRVTGQCSGTGFGLISALIAQSNYDNCRNGYLAQGYQDGPAPILAVPSPYPYAR